MEYNENFLIQTAKDYCMELETVKDIAKKTNEDNFYEFLEEELERRREKDYKRK